MSNFPPLCLRHRLLVYARTRDGTGRHPCIGMRFAKLEVKCIMAMFLTGYDYDVVDKAGVKLSRLPVPDRNNLYVNHYLP